MKLEIFGYVPWKCSFLFTSSDANTTDEEMVSAVLKYVSNYNVWIYMYVCLCDSLRVFVLFMLIK